MKIAIRRLTSNKQQLPSPKSKLTRYLLKVNDFKMQVLKAYENCKEQDLQRTNSNFLHLLLIPSFLEFLTKSLYNIRTLQTSSILFILFSYLVSFKLLNISL